MRVHNKDATQQIVLSSASFAESEAHSHLNRWIGDRGSKASAAAPVASTQYSSSSRKSQMNGGIEPCMARRTSPGSPFRLVSNRG